jgi:quinol monooxygenase YgiN
MAELTIVAKVVAKAEHVARVRDELLKLVDPTRNEAGCISYTLHQDNDDPAVFLFYETWENMERLEAHMRTEHFLNYVAAVEAMLAEKSVAKMTRIA